VPGAGSVPLAARLAAAGCVAADEEAAELTAAAPDGSTLEAWITRRENGEPFAWIVGTAPFCGHSVRVDRGVYVPRPQSEELARRAAALLPDHGAAADICTGSGAVAVHVARAVPTALVVGIDRDLRSAQCARTNGVAAVVGDLGESLRTAAFDVVTAVAPYVPTDQLRYLPADVQRYEPRFALDGGEDGLELIRRIVVVARRVLRPGGWLVLEVGGDQDAALAPVLDGEGFLPPVVWSDEDGDIRGLASQVRTA